MKWKIFDSQFDNELSLPDEPGIYLVCIKKGEVLPKSMQKLRFSHINGNKIIYVGISNRGLRSRDFYDHFIRNNSGRSTLRKSLGVLILRNPNKIPRNKNCKPHQYKFKPKDENELTQWMENNLILYYNIVKNPISYEDELIERYNPLLNINKNKNIINSEFRKKLRKLRKDC